MNDDSGFSRLNHPPARCCSRHSLANRDAISLASLTSSVATIPAGSSWERSSFVLQNLSCFRAEEKVRHGGAPCNHRTFCFLRCFFSIAKWVLFKMSNTRSSSCSVFPISGSLRIPWVSSAAYPLLRTAAVNPPTPAKISKNLLLLVPPPRSGDVDVDVDLDRFNCPLDAARSS